MSGARCCRAADRIGSELACERLVQIELCHDVPYPEFSTGTGTVPHGLLHSLTFVFHQRLFATLMPSNACGGADRSTRDAPIGRQGGAEVSAKATLAARDLTEGKLAAVGSVGMMRSRVGAGSAGGRQPLS